MICVYTAIFGEYDRLHQPVAQSCDCDFVCFTDADLPARVGAWRVIRSGLHGRLHPRLRAKYFKCMSHRVFPRGRLAWRFAPLAYLRYDATIWIDGSIRIKSPSFAEEFTDCMGDAGLSMFAHPDRACIYDEVGASRVMTKYSGLPFDEQVESYRADGFPQLAGLMAGGLIARRAGQSGIPAIEAAWWAENLRWTYQDQLSLPVVLWRLGAGYDAVPLNLWDNPWFDRVDHLSDG